MKPSEQSTTIRRIERRFRILNWLTGTVMTLLGIGGLIFFGCNFNWMLHGAIAHTGNSRAAYGIVICIAALMYGVITLARQIKSGRRKSSKDN